MVLRAGLDCFCAGLDCFCTGLDCRETCALCVRVDLLAGQQADDRNALIASDPASRGAGRSGPPRRCRGLPTGYDPVVLGDLILDLDVQIGIDAALARDEPVHTWSTNDARLDARGATDVVGGHQLVDQLEASLVPNRLDEHPYLVLIGVGHAAHRPDDVRLASAQQGRIPHSFPARFGVLRPLSGRCIVTP